MDAVKLYNKFTMDELLKKMDDIKSDPKNRNPEGGFYIYTKPAMRKLDALTWAITYHLRDSRIARGETINENGYTGKGHK